MAKGMLIVFGAVMAGAVLGADVFTQYQKAAANGQSFSASAYVDSITARFQYQKEQNALKERQAQPARTHLPEAPDGWVRSAWTPEDDAPFQALETPREMSDDEKAIMEVVDNHIGVKLMKGDALMKYRSQRKQNTWVYRKGDQTVFLSASYAQPDQRMSRQAAAMKLVQANMGMMTVYEPYAAYAGVAWIENKGFMAFDPGNAAATKRDTRLSARLGNRIRLQAEALASDDAIHELLSQIDYDGLNAMLEQPLETVGSHVPDMSRAQQIAFAQAYMDKRRAKSAQERKTTEEQLMKALELSPAEKALVGVFGGTGKGATDTLVTRDNAVQAQNSEIGTTIAGAPVKEAAAKPSEGGSGLLGGMLKKMSGADGADGATREIDLTEEAQKAADQQKGFMARLFGQGDDAQDSTAELAETAVAEPGADGAEGGKVVINRLVNKKKGSNCGRGKFCQVAGKE